MQKTVTMYIIYDYRGYGRSEGKRRLKAIVHDVKEILTSLTAQAYEKRLVYAMSLGGVFFLNSLDPGTQLTRSLLILHPVVCPTMVVPSNTTPLKIYQIIAPIS